MPLRHLKTYICVLFGQQRIWYKHIDIQVRKMDSIFWTVNKNQSFSICRFSHFLGLFCVLLGQSADRCPIFLLLVIETDKFLKPNTQLAHFLGNSQGNKEKQAFEPTIYFFVDSRQLVLLVGTTLLIWAGSSVRDLTCKKEDLMIGWTAVLSALHMTGGWK